jgi:periplasmic protein TonB
MQKTRVVPFVAILLFILASCLYGKTNAILELQGTEYLAFADQMPEPIGGLPEIYKLIKYPEIAMRAGVEGKVYVLAFINEEGGVDDVKVIKGIGAGCDEATIEAVKNTKFAPGKTAGKSAKVKMSLQIQFKLG